jgi:hypothetical protein
MALRTNHSSNVFVLARAKEPERRARSGALLLITLLLTVSHAGAETFVPGQRPHRTEGAYVLACRFPELFEAQALEFTRSRIVYGDDRGQFEDSKAAVDENQYRVQTSSDGFLCIQTVSRPDAAQSCGRNSLLAE